MEGRRENQGMRGWKREEGNDRRIRKRRECGEEYRY